MKYNKYEYEHIELYIKTHQPIARTKELVGKIMLIKKGQKYEDAKEFISYLTLSGDTVSDLKIIIDKALKLIEDYAKG